MTIPDYIASLDEHDELASLRDHFSLPAKKIYLDGNSLGPLPSAVSAAVRDGIDRQWGNDLITSWNTHHWIELPTICGEKIAKIIGAAAGQVTCCDSISINLYKLLGAATKLKPERSVILSQTDNFPTDLYVANSFAEANGYSLKTTSAGELREAIDESVSVLLLTEVNFRSGDRHNIKELTRLAHKKGGIVIWDLAHSAGAVPLSLDKWDVDFAVGCGYKFLNGGPGAPAFVYAASRHHASLTQPLQGWMGHASPFSFNSDFIPAEGLKQFLTGTPNVISMIALNAALDVFEDLDMGLVFQKSRSLSTLFIEQLEMYPALKELTLISPKDSMSRGSQLALSHGEAFAISQAMIDREVIVDFRDPDILRFGITPLFTSHREIWQAVHTLNDIVERRLYENQAYQTRRTVT